MHTVHVADEVKEGFGYAAVGIFFSVNDFDSTVDDALKEKINKFFDSL